MSVVKNLADVSKEEQKKFIDSFDVVLSDLDGVLWLARQIIPGASKCMGHLKKLGKHIHYISNNGVSSPEQIYNTLHKAELDLTLNDVVVPSEITVFYLKTINFNKDIFVSSCKPMKDALKKNGFKLLPDPPFSIEENITTTLEFNDENPNVGAVILDNDFNMTYIKLQKAFWYLRNPGCLFLITHKDKMAPFGAKGPLIGPYYSIDTLKDLTKKDFIELGKPSEYCSNYVKQKFNITQPKRALFIGDSIPADMQMGAIGGFQKLLVLSGITKLEDINNWDYPENLKPDYYVQDLGVLNEIIINIYTEEL